MKYQRESLESRPVVAICYDFDKTLSPDNMQAQGYLESIDYDDQDVFWKEVVEMAAENEMDSDLAWMYKMLKGSHGKLIVNRKTLRDYGAHIHLNPGVDSWFERMKLYGEENGVIVEHYIISSGIKEMIEGTRIAREGAFKKIYASSFFYDSDGVAIWPAMVVNYTNKTQYLFRISKGVLNVNDNGVNDYFPPDRMRVPFTNMVYIGDSDTDIPCMKLIKSHGGYSIGVYDCETGDRTKVNRMLAEDRIGYIAAADYTDGSELDTLVKSIITEIGGSKK